MGKGLLQMCLGSWPHTEGGQTNDKSVSQKGKGSRHGHPGTAACDKTAARTVALQPREVQVLPGSGGGKKLALQPLWEGLPEL